MKLIASMRDDALSTIGNINPNNPPTYKELVYKLSKRLNQRTKQKYIETKWTLDAEKRGEFGLSGI